MTSLTNSRLLKQKSTVYVLERLSFSRFNWLPEHCFSLRTDRLLVLTYPTTPYPRGPNATIAMLCWNHLFMATFSSGAFVSSIQLANLRPWPTQEHDSRKLIITEWLNLPRLNIDLAPGVGIQNKFVQNTKKRLSKKVKKQPSKALSERPWFECDPLTYLGKGVCYNFRFQNLLLGSLCHH